MNKKIKFIIAFVFLILFLISSDKSAFAQGRFWCDILHSGQCLPGKKANECQTGYIPGNCSVWSNNPTSCQEAHTCVSTAPAGSEIIDFEKIQQTAFPSLKNEFQIENNSSVAEKVGRIISTILPYLFVFAGLIVLFYLIAGGFQVMLSAGDDKALSEAKKKITNALFGFLLLFISYWLVQIIEIILGITIF